MEVGELVEGVCVCWGGEGDTLRIRARTPCNDRKGEGGVEKETPCNIHL